MIGKMNLKKLTIEQLLRKHKEACERVTLAKATAQAVEEELNARGYYFTPCVTPQRRLFDGCSCLERMGDDANCPIHGKAQR